MKHHFSLHHDDQEYKCEICQFVAKNKIKLYRHRSETHNVVKQPVTCNLCDKEFRDNYNLKVHQESQHFNVKYPCHICGHLATRKQYLDNHLKTMHEKKEIKQ